jgi:hypothetical protein
MNHGCHIKNERKEIRLETYLLTVAAAIKFGTRPSPPPRPVTYSTREPSPSHITDTARSTRDLKNALSSMQKDPQPSQACSGGRGSGGPKVENLCAYFRWCVGCIFPVGVGKIKTNPSSKKNGPRGHQLGVLVRTYFYIFFAHIPNIQIIKKICAMGSINAAYSPACKQGHSLNNRARTQRP